jgi:methyltransferase (TIGR00027 family)
VELSGIAKTALGVAYVRAWESSQTERLFADPYALAFVTAQYRQAGAPGASALAAHVVLRTRFFDDYLLAAGCEQVVLVAAGLDTRAYRLTWPDDVTLFELDQPEVLAFKQAVLDRERAVPGCDRRAVPVDLRLDWAAALIEAGFDPARRTAWLVEGLLIYLSRDEAERLLTTIGGLSATDSRLSFEDTGADPALVAPNRDLHEYSALFRGGLGREAMPWLEAAGWKAESHERAAVASGYGRDALGQMGAGFITARFAGNA